MNSYFWSLTHWVVQMNLRHSLDLHSVPLFTFFGSTVFPVCLSRLKLIRKLLPRLYGDWRTPLVDRRLCYDQSVLVIPCTRSLIQQWTPPLSRLSACCLLSTIARALNKHNLKKLTIHYLWSHLVFTDMINIIRSLTVFRSYFGWYWWEREAKTTGMWVSRCARVPGHVWLSVWWNALKSVGSSVWPALLSVSSQYAQSFFLCCKEMLYTRKPVKTNMSGWVWN